MQVLAFERVSGYITGYYVEAPVGDSAQKRALQNYRTRLNERGMARFEVLGLGTDRELIRTLARRLADDSPDAKNLRASMHRTIAGKGQGKGGILQALRRSPLVGADLEFTRSDENGRKVGL